MYTKHAGTHDRRGRVYCIDATSELIKHVTLETLASATVDTFPGNGSRVLTYYDLHAGQGAGRTERDGSAVKVLRLMRKKCVRCDAYLTERFSNARAQLAEQTREFRPSAETDYHGAHVWTAWEHAYRTLLDLSGPRTLIFADPDSCIDYKLATSIRAGRWVRMQDLGDEPVNLLVTLMHFAARGATIMASFPRQTLEGEDERVLRNAIAFPTITERTGTVLTTQYFEQGSIRRDSYLLVAPEAVLKRVTLRHNLVARECGRDII
jgi:hypothetical protein